MTARSIALFVAAAFAEIGGAYLVWLGIKEHKGVAFVALGAMALDRLRRARRVPDRATSSAACWPPTAACSSSDRCCGASCSTVSSPIARTSIGALVCLTGVGIIMYAR